jgi:hypothetical protein
MSFFKTIEKLCDYYNGDFTRLNDETVMVNNSIVKNNGFVYVKNHKMCINKNPEIGCNQDYFILKGVKFNDRKFSDSFTENQEIALSFILRVLELNKVFPETKRYTMPNLKEELEKKEKSLITILGEGCARLYNKSRKRYTDYEFGSKNEELVELEKFYDNVQNMINLLENDYNVTCFDQFHSLVFHKHELNIKKRQLLKLQAFFNDHFTSSPGVLIHLGFNKFVYDEELEKVSFIYDDEGNGISVNFVNGRLSPFVEDMDYMKTLL